MSESPFTYRWQLLSKHKPAEIWPLVSDTNRLFRSLGQLPVQRAAVSHDLPKGHNEITYEQLHRLDIWEEEPYQWEAPYHLKVKRTYKNGICNTLLFSADISQYNGGSRITFTFSGQAKGLMSKLRLNRVFGNRGRRNLKKLLHEYDSILNNGSHTDSNSSWFPVNNGQKWEKLTHELKELSNDEELSRKLVQTVRKADFTDLDQLQPLDLAKRWKQPLHRVIDILFYASKLDLLNFSWSLACPHCRTVQHTVRKLPEITEPLFCKDCQKEFMLDFHNSIYINFRPHPLVRKVPDKTYCFGNPSKQPHIKLFQYLYPGQKRFVKVHLKPGNYRIYADGLDSVVHARVNESGMDNATLSFNKERKTDQEAVLSSDPNLVIDNQTDERIFVVIEDTDWKKYSISASEVTSLQLFRNLFPREVIRENEKIKAGSVTVMFTDLYNSSSLYNSEGDDNAIGHVIDHFEVLRKIMREERGAIVKTIGDAVMAVFQSPVGAVRAFKRSQEYFKEQPGLESKIKLKGGIHTGDCTTLTLNNRIDFFGNTVNIAARLVENARSEELVISDAACECNELEQFIDEHRESIKIHHFDVALKGFEDLDMEARRLSMSRTNLRLVV